MTRPAVRTDFDEPLDIHCGLLAEIPFHAALFFDDLPDVRDFFFRKVFNLLVGIDSRAVQDGERRVRPMP